MEGLSITITMTADRVLVQDCARRALAQLVAEQTGAPITAEDVVIEHDLTATIYVKHQGDMLIGMFKGKSLEAIAAECQPPDGGTINQRLDALDTAVDRFTVDSSLELHDAGVTPPCDGKNGAEWLEEVVADIDRQVIDDVDEPDEAGWSIRQDALIAKLHLDKLNEGGIARQTGRKPREIRERLALLRADFGDVDAALDALRPQVQAADALKQVSA